MKDLGRATSSRSVHVTKLQEFTRRAFQSTGLSLADAETGADVLVTTDAWGVFTHGTKSLAGYLRRLQAGGLRTSGQPTVVAEGSAWAIMDGGSALGMITSTVAMEKAMATAKSAGVAYVGVRNSCHFGAAGYYAWLAARQGLIGITFANDRPSVTAPGARGAMLGSNPIAYAIPTGRHRPIILDIATSTVAGGKVAAARALGKRIPPDWLVDADGRPTTDPADFYKGGALAPMAGHKGYGFALLGEVLAGVLTGAALRFAVGSWIESDPSLATGHGAAFLAIDPGMGSPASEFPRRIDLLIDEIHAAPKAAGATRIYVPGEREWEHYDQAIARGIELPPDVLDSLDLAARLSGQDLRSLFD
ncbi:MAG TPA: Ldh family oxidoreductase [Planctomycetota bacterium]|nr:Ldh family oxidoreductase [Planctomycetota bacterium]